MTSQPPDKEATKKHYEEIYPKYERMARNIEQALGIFLKEAGIDVLGINYRIKEFESFFDKINRKQYKKPFEEIKDICGLRIICSYTSDLEKISKIINKEFNVRESDDKEQSLEADQFGYRSQHYIVSIKKKWLDAPNYRGLEGLKAEIQVRTILMHAWADVEHKLAYKKKEQVPRQFERQLNQISALFENIDGQLETLRRERYEYIEKLTSTKAKETGRFDVSQPLNLDSLQAYLDFYFNDREKNINRTRELYYEISKYKIGIKELVEGYEQAKDILPQFEREYIRKIGNDERLVQVGLVQSLLALINDDYYEERKWLFSTLIPSIDKWRKKLRASN